MNDQTPPSDNPSRCNRRALLIGGCGAAATLVGYPLVREVFGMRANVFVAARQQYNGRLVTTIRDGLLASGIGRPQVDGRSVLLKPNLVEPTRLAPQMTTHPAMILAAAEVFRSWGAHVVVGEAPGHVRDTEMALLESGVHDALDREQLPFADLNYEEVAWVPNRGKASKLDGFYLPRSIVEADLVVSMPKMKTHHWVGMTGAMKNMYGTLPGIKYGWPKNVLHHNGIPETVFDINASLPKTVAIVDGITCMEGDGPIMGTAKQMGLVLIGSNPASVDATMARIMGFDPEKISYLQLAAERLGPLVERRIRQTGERWEDHVDPFAILNDPYLQSLRDPKAAEKVSGIPASGNTHKVCQRRCRKACRKSGKVIG